MVRFGLARRRVEPDLRRNASVRSTHATASAATDSHWRPQATLKRLSGDRQAGTSSSRLPDAEFWMPLRKTWLNPDPVGEWTPRAFGRDAQVGRIPIPTHPRPQRARESAVGNRERITRPRA